MDLNCISLVQRSKWNLIRVLARVEEVPTSRLRGTLIASCSRCRVKERSWPSSSERLISLFRSLLEVLIRILRSLSFLKSIHLMVLCLRVLVILKVLRTQILQETRRFCRKQIYVIDLLTSKWVTLSLKIRITIFSSLKISLSLFRYILLMLIKFRMLLETSGKNLTFCSLTMGVLLTLGSSRFFRTI